MNILQDNDLTSWAYRYAVDKKKVNQGVIEAYKRGFERGFSYCKNRPIDELLDHLRSKVRDLDDIRYDLGMSDARRSPNELEKLEAKKADLFNEMIAKYKAIEADIRDYNEKISDEKDK